MGTHQTPLPPREDYGGLLVSLARQEQPDTSAFNDPEIVWRIAKPHHVGFIVRSDSPARIRELLDDYAARIARDYHASAPPKDMPGH